MTCDHSLFSLNESGRIIPVKTSNLSVGSYITVPSQLPEFGQQMRKILWLEHADFRRKGFLISTELKPFISQKWEFIQEVGKENGYSKSRLQHGNEEDCFPSHYLLLPEHPRLFPMHPSIQARPQIEEIPIVWSANDDIVTLAGLWLADGCYDGKYGIVVSVGDEPSKQLLNAYQKASD